MQTIEIEQGKLYLGTNIPPTLENKVSERGKYFQIERVPAPVSLMDCDRVSSWVKFMAEKFWLISTWSR